MPTFKVVVIGASGVGKTSLRGQYISARFSTSYRATIGADFITKTLPPLTPGGEPVVLQLWDTAGQERFSSLASAFFRGADAAVLMYDVTTPATLHALSTWWAEFRDKAPVADADVGRFCVAVVGNKIDLVEGTDEGAVSPAQGARFVRALVPRPGTPPALPARLSLSTSPADESDDEDADDDALASSQLTARPPSSSTPTPAVPPTTLSITPLHLFPASRRPASPLRGRSSSRSRLTLGSIKSTLTVFHTPSSSVYSDTSSFHTAHSSYASASDSAYDDARSEATVRPSDFSRSRSRSSPRSAHPSSAPSTRAPSPLHVTPAAYEGDAGPSSSALSPLPYPQHFPRSASLVGLSTAAAALSPVNAAGTSSSGSSLSDEAAPSARAIQWLAEPDLPLPSGAGAAHFRVSARTGAGVSDVFAWVARRLVANLHRSVAEDDARMGFEGDPRVSLAWGGSRPNVNGNGRAGGGGAEERLRRKKDEGRGGCC
ncbi:ras-domain-containing protein [Mycena belliarum]|uniref:Ras-domain-containing protein n=1 Tax=Mycena belliarum TaxID=1033014 RepID=A0AAD6U749_9AGAR|nr:ras-domain-containing protein [Mycena belliae]